MHKMIRIALAVGVASLLAACGSPTGLPAGMPGGVPGGMPGFNLQQPEPAVLKSYAGSRYTLVQIADLAGGGNPQ